MKIIYTFLLILICLADVGAQTSNNNDQKEVPGVPTISLNHSFSIIKAYPNPVKDEVTISLQSERSGDIQIALINILGSVVKKWEPVLVGAGERKLILDLSSFKTGIYVLKLTKSDQVATQFLKKY